MTPIESGLSVILPVCGQAQAAEKAIPAWLSVLERSSGQAELIVVDDGTLAQGVTTSFKQGNPLLQIIPSPDKKGYGHGLQLGIAASKYDLLFLTGLDQPFPIAEIFKIVQEINYKTEEGTIIPVDLVNIHRKGVKPSGLDQFLQAIRNGLERLVLGTWPTPKQAWLPKSERWLPRMMRLWYGIRIHDPASRHKLIRRRILEKMIVQSAGSFATLEILAKANFLGAIIGETLIPDRPSSFDPQPIQEADTRKIDEKQVWSSPRFVLNLPEKTPPQLVPSQ